MSDFEKFSAETLRAHKGKSFVGITTVFFCHDGNGNYCFEKRSSKARDEHGKWGFGGGGLKFGSTLKENVEREVQEEYGVIPSSVEFLGYRDVFRVDTEGVKTHWLGMYFKAQVDRNKVYLADAESIDEIAWHTIDSLPEPLHSQDYECVKKFYKQLK